MGPTVYAFEAELWRWRPEEGGSWFFVSVPFEIADEIDETSGPKRGFGSVRVGVTVGSVTWRTSLFPSKEHKTYVLPVKAAVRKANDLAEGDLAKVRLTLVD
ncbi:hypothetical protein Back2_17310 [Nocardioides baekrokdamisoli]|uniref:DUF1905 domain-containing protein n=1 Tax=Nocardioides baekrokdamisoli TaxID=1804624 RepID=A0A3G9J1W3_9ACTN|nr:DUF1905 domain-containing protein [Nocardioides baekrokdamisoli]BBH17444.1 hypothetical protein Back2_17310 [Nocardioides baekrokdamisoli]